MPVYGFWPATVCAFQNCPYALEAGLCDETDTEYDLRFEADEEYVRELIDRTDEMSLLGAKLCVRCSENHPGKVGRKTWQGAVRGLQSEC